MLRTIEKGINAFLVVLKLEQIYTVSKPCLLELPLNFYQQVQQEVWGRPNQTRVNKTPQDKKKKSVLQWSTLSKLSDNCFFRSGRWLWCIILIEPFS